MDQAPSSGMSRRVRPARAGSSDRNKTASAVDDDDFKIRKISRTENLVHRSGTSRGEG